MIYNCQLCEDAITRVHEYPSGIIINLGREIDHFKTYNTLVIVGKDKDKNVDIEYMSRNKMRNEDINAIDFEIRDINQLKF